jgi:hypothetical protein
MPLVLAIPLVIVAVEKAAVAVLFIASAVAVAWAAHEATEAIDKALDDSDQDASTDRTRDITATEECPKRRPCKACTPAVGTIAVERVDRVPPSVAHFPCPGDHAHLVQMNQNPRTCQCFWNKATPDVYCLEPGELPPYPPK